MYKGINGCMYNCSDNCTGECMKSMDESIDKKEKFVDWIEHMVGQQITDYDIKPKFDGEGNILSYDIMVQPKSEIQKIEIPITILPTKQQKVMNKKEIIGKKFDLDLSYFSPVSVVVKEITEEDKVIVEYLNSTPGRTEEFSISDFEYFALIKIEEDKTKFKVGDKAWKPKGYKFPCTIVSVFTTIKGEIRLVAEMDEYGLLHIFNEQQLEHYE